MKPRVAFALVVGAALVLVALAARGTSPVPYVDRGGGGGDAPAAPAPAIGDENAGVGASAPAGSFVLVLVVVSLIALVGGLVVLFGMLGRWKRSRRAVGAVGETLETGGVAAEPPEILVRGAREALDDLRARPNGPPGDAVIAAWLRLERAAADSGAPRRDHETPTEFTGNLLARYRVDQDAAGTLRRVYQRARFGRADVTEADAETAREALATIVRDLG